MKAVQVSQPGPPDVLQYVDVETPLPGPDQVLVRTESISVNYADVSQRRGTYPWMPALPAILGMEASGIVEAVGAGVRQMKPGQRALVMGAKCYAEYVVADTDYSFLLPDDVDTDEAAALPVNYLTAYHMLHTIAKVEVGETVLCYACAGGVGTALIQLAKLASLKVIGLTSRPEKAQYASKQGADKVINRANEDVVGVVKEITNGKGVNLILNPVAGETFMDDFKMLAPLGHLIWYGMIGGPPQISLVEQLAANFGKGISLSVFHLFLSVALPYPNLLKQSAETMIRYLRTNKIKPHIYERIPLIEAAYAHELLESRVVTGKLILKP